MRIENVMLLTVAAMAIGLASRVIADDQKTDVPASRIAADSIIRHEVQVNTYTSSSQSAPAIANHPDGGFTVVWHSRRQQAGTYGIYLQRFSKTGAAIGAEHQVNLFTHSMQMNPAVAIDSSGASWVAWESFGQDGSFNAIIARRFEGEGFTGSDEILVNQFKQGNQSEVVVATNDDGIASFFWVTQTEDGKKKQIVTRCFDSSGKSCGDEIVVSNSKQHQCLPVVSSANGQMVVVWPEQDRYGRPAGIFGRKIDFQGHSVGDTFAISNKDHARHIEPSVAIDSCGKFVVAWLRNVGLEYEIYCRNFDANTEPANAPIRVSMPGSKYISGAAVASNENNRFVVMWNQQTDAFGSDVNISAQIFDDDGKRFGSIFLVNASLDGRHRLAAASGKSRVTWGPDQKQLRIAWFGKNQLDESSVNITAIVPGESEFHFADPKSLTEFGTDTAENVNAKPHEPPTYDPKLIAKDPFGGFDLLGPVGTDFGFTAINATGWNPPDPVVAAGPNHLVAMTNGAIAFFDKSGTLTFSDQIEGPDGFWGALGATGLVFDPEVLFDPHSNRFFAMANERANGGGSFFLLAVSDDDNPNGNWFRYRLDVTSISDLNIDSPNMAVDEDVVYLTADFFSPDRYLVYMIRKSDLLVGGPVSTTDLLINGSQSYGLPLMYDSNAPAFYMIQAFEFGIFSSVRFHAITDALGNPQRVTTDVSVPAYGHPRDPAQQGTSSRPELFEARFWSCVYRDGSLWAVHHQSPTASATVRARWYEFAMNDWPKSGQLPQLVQSGDVTPTNISGQTSATFFPSIWVDQLGNAAITMARSSNTEFISMSRAVRSAGDPPGTFQDVQLVQPSTTPFTAGGRWGDYSGTNSDPAEPGSFWGIHEFAQSNGIWQTYIAKYVVEGTTTIFPASVSASPGTITSGSIVELQQSDDLDLELVAEIPVVPGGQQIVTQITGNSVKTDFTALTCVVETSANTPNLVQDIELFNFVTSQYEVVDSRVPEILDLQIEIEIAGDVSRFVTPGSGLLLARISFGSTGPALFFPWQCTVDQFNWRISN